MGSDLTAAPDGKAIRLMIRALRDPDGANLDRVQIITGWLDGSGDLQEKIYDIACSDDLPVGENNRCGGLVGSTVNVADLVHAMRTSLGNSAACRLSEQRNSSPRYKTVALALLYSSMGCLISSLCAWNSLRIRVLSLLCSARPE